MAEIILSAITLSLNSILGLLIIFRNPRSWTNRLFFLLTFFINIYIIVNYISLHPPDTSPQTQLFWIRFVMFVCSFIGPTLFLLVDTFPGEPIRTRKPLIVFLLLLCAVSASLSLSPFVFSGIDYPSGSPVPIPAPGIVVFMFDFVGLFLISIIWLFVRYLRSKGRERLQRFFFLIGVLGTFSIMALTTVLLVVLLKNSSFVFIGPNATLILVACLAYAIARHRFLDLKLIIFRALTFFLMLTIGGIGYILLMLTLGSSIFNIRLKSLEMVFFAITTFGIGLSLPLLRRFFETITSPIFFHTYYDDRALLKSITDTITRTIDLERLTNEVFKELFLHMRVSSCYINLYEDGESVWNTAFHYRTGDLDPNVLFKLARKLLKHNAVEKIYLFDELTDESSKEAFRQLNCTVLLPLIIKRELIGVLILGEKATGELYSGQDIEILKIIAPELAVGIKNALAYQEIQEFNERLKQEVREATADLRSANSRLKTLDARKDEFISIASHELRTPLTAIRGYLWMSLHQPPAPLHPTIKDNLDICYRSAERMILLVNDMLTISRIEKNKLELKPEEVNLVEVLQSLYDEMKIHAQEKDVVFQFEHSGDELKVSGDSGKLREVFQNLVGNALKFVPKGGFVKMEGKRNDGKIEITISDNGPGIPKEDQDRLFTKFGKIKHAYDTTGAQMGTGLGLYICKKILDLHSGTISVQSAEDKGAQFRVRLPAMH